MKKKWGLSILLFACLLNGLTAQVTPGNLREIVRSGPRMDSLGIRFQKELKEFYDTLSNHGIWMLQGCEKNRNTLLAWLKSSAHYGLNEEDYQFRFVQSFRQNNQTLSAPDSLVAELLLTDAAIHFLSDLVYGNTSPAFSYTGLPYAPSCFDIPATLLTNIVSNTFTILPDLLEPAMKEIKMIRSMINRLQTIIDQKDYKEEMIISAKVGADNYPLCKKLFYLGLLDSMGNKWPDSLIKSKVKEAQYSFNIVSDGVLRSTALSEFNTAIGIRLQQLKLSLNYYRWLSCLSREQQVIVVNIPAAYLKVYYKGKTTLEMRLIVGKPATPTPTLSSQVKEVILYPYWVIPSSIISKELLPAVQRNPGYIEANGYQVLNQQGKIIDPSTVNWAALSPGHFPYMIRQSTGCDNALGLLKLNFYNPFTVYLHDTPKKSLFLLQKRFFSHGCMRMQNPSALGHLVLKNNKIAIDTLEAKGCLRNQSPIVVPADVQMPVIVWYNPVGTDSTGRIIFYQDIYNTFRWVKTP